MKMRKAAIDHTGAPSVRGASRKGTRTTVQGGLRGRDEINSTSQMLASLSAAHVQMDSDGLRYEAVSAARKLVCAVNMVRWVTSARCLASADYMKGIVLLHKTIYLK